MKHRAVCIIGAALQQEPRDTVVILFHMIPLTKNGGLRPAVSFLLCARRQKAHRQPQLRLPQLCFCLVIA